MIEPVHRIIMPDNHRDVRDDRDTRRRPHARLPMRTPVGTIEIINGDRTVSMMEDGERLLPHDFPTAAEAIEQFNASLGDPDQHEPADAVDGDADDREEDVA